MPPCLSALLSHPRARDPGPCGTRPPRGPGPSIAPSCSSPHLLTLDRAGQPREPLLCNDCRGLHPPGMLPGKGGVAPQKGRAGTAGAVTRRGWFFPPVCPSPGRWMGFQARVALLRAAAAAPSLPVLHRAAPPPFAPLRSARRGPRGDPGPGSAAPHIKNRSAEPRRTRASSGRDARGGRASLSPPPAHPHTCARLCVRGGVSPSGARWRPRGAPRPPFAPSPHRVCGCAGTSRRLRALCHGPRALPAPSFIASLRRWRHAAAGPALSAERAEILRKKSAKECGEATPTRALPMNEKSRVNPEQHEQFRRDWDVRKKARGRSRGFGRNRAAPERAEWGTKGRRAFVQLR